LFHRRDCKLHIEGTPQIAQVALHQDEPDMIQGMNTEDISLNEGRVYYDIRFLAIAARKICWELPKNRLKIMT